jgi:LmbE family N-acetylglucosaminyl deacetylase
MTRRSPRTEGQRSSSLEQLLQRTLVIVAHPDDEAVTCGALLQRIESPMVVFCTDGTPDSRYFWGSCDSRQVYQSLRRNEALKALHIAGVSEFEFLAGTNIDSLFRDQHLYRVLRQAIEVLDECVLRFRPQTLLAPAYEGGHPDHDSCGFLANALGRKYGLPVWEMPLYYRSATDELVCQTFLGSRGNEVLLYPNELESMLKELMINAYQSQPSVWNFVRADMVETFRPQPQYDYGKPPHLGLLNYEKWQWPMTGVDLCNAFTAFESQGPDLQFVSPHAKERSVSLREGDK